MKKIFFAFLVVLICVFGPRWFSFESFSKISPKGFYRITFYEPGFPYFFSFDKQYPIFVKMFDNKTGKLLNESEIFDLNAGGGAVQWPIKGQEEPEIVIGTSVERWPAPLEKID